MVAQRQATTRTRRRAVRATAAATGDDGDGARARELARLQAMRAEALSWVAEIERRIAAMEQREA